MNLAWDGRTLQLALSIDHDLVVGALWIFGLWVLAGCIVRVIRAAEGADR